MLTTRRQALKTLTAAAIASTALNRFTLAADASAPAPAAPAAAPAPAPTGPFKLPPLPYAYEALEPHIDAETMHLHHDKHHATYVAKLNEAIAKADEVQSSADRTKPYTLLSTKKIDDILSNLTQVPEEERTAIRNQGGGHSNHSLFWQALSPKGGGAPKGEIVGSISTDLGGFDKLKEAMTKAGLGLFGSGWVWLVFDGSTKKLAILTSPNQDSPLMGEHYPLFGIDVWEHAYYLKYHNVRADYLAAIWNVVNWDFISERYVTARKG